MYSIVCTCTLHMYRVCTESIYRLLILTTYLLCLGGVTTELCRQFSADSGSSDKRSHFGVNIMYIMYITGTAAHHVYLLGVGGLEISLRNLETVVVKKGEGIHLACTVPMTVGGADICGSCLVLVIIWSAYSRSNSTRKKKWCHLSLPIDWRGASNSNARAPKGKRAPV